MSQPLFTITVTLVCGRIHTFENVEEEHAERFKQVVWVRGCTVPINELTREQVSPYRITTVLITRQTAVIPAKQK